MGNLVQMAGEYGIALTEAQENEFILYRDLLLEWNQKMNLTAITEPDEVDKKHFIDSLLVLVTDWITPNAKIIDVGSGAGFPGLPLAIARPDVQVNFADSLRKRLRFLEEVTGKISNKQYELTHGRAEDLGRNKIYREHYDFAVARAVAPLPVLVEYTLPFVRVGGSLIAWKGPKAEEEIEEAKRSIGQLGGKHKETIWLDAFGMKRALVRIEKIKPTPPQFPRQPKKIQEKPL